jgi:4-hydroxy-3-polyprenylbenzoate decarboxylase
MPKDSQRAIREAVKATDEAAEVSPQHAGDPALELRCFLERAQNAGELQVIEGADWNLEIGALTEIFAELETTPALLFDKIPGYASGYRVLSNILKSPLRESLALGLRPGLRGVELARGVKERLNSLNPMAPVDIKEGPILENVLDGDDVNLFKFPTPKWHELDGGRYIGTFNAVVCKDPDSGYVNVGTYRVQIHDEKTVGVNMIAGKHGDLIGRKYWEKGEECPFLIVCGMPPSLMMATGLGLPWATSEYDFLGGFLGRPVPITKAGITGLPMPASSEIVLEGFAPPPETESRIEGPFGEWPGYYASGPEQAPIIKVRRIYHRNDPIITGSPPLKTYLNSELPRYVRAANIWCALERSGVPEVKGVWFPRHGRFIAAVAIRQRYPGHAKQAALGVLSTRDGGRDTRMVIVVDDDIDITNINELLWAVSSRWDPKTSSEILDIAASSLNPRVPPEKKAKNDLISSCIIIDACRPYSWRKDFPLASAASPEYKEKIKQKWAHILPGHAR